ncbi:Tyrosine-protein kinase Abl [Gryllus bimaculatus]|nr:Tyrosine-protein kinase Abl [Gryllus bimaculatus]
MEQNTRVIFVHVSVDNGIKEISIRPYSTAEDVCTEIAVKLGIGPVSRHLFALRLHGSNIYLSPNCKLFDAHINASYDFRLRYKVPSLSRLKHSDIKAYNYYFHQARGDVMNNQIPDISSEKYKSELVGLGVADMYRVMLEEGVERDIVENDYKKYIPKDVIRHHLFFIKKPIHETLGRIKKGGSHDAWYVKGEYLKQFEEMAPNYLSEDFKVLSDEGGSVRSVFVNVNPFHKEEPGIRLCYDGKKQWLHLCTIEELIYISVRNDGTVEISRKNGIPTYFKFRSIPLMFSFVSLLDGYYRLMVKWTFNLCKDVRSPSVQKLHELKCHGPVGGEFSYAKLEEKRNNKCGCFIIRESESKYNVLFLDVCTKGSSKPKTLKIDKVGTQFLFSADGCYYDSLSQLLAAYREEKGGIYLQECLPPSEYDRSSLLLCQPDTGAKDSSFFSGLGSSTPSGTPVCIDIRNLQVYKNHKKESRGGKSVVYRTLWRMGPGKKLEVAMKILKPEYREKHLKDFMDLCGRWAFLQTSAIVRLYGITLASPFAMVSEYLSLGPLDHHLQHHHHEIKTVDLIEAGTYLATALWHLVSMHWIPPECYLNLEVARSVVAADVWAFGTTLWEIFMFGEPVFERVTNLDAVKKGLLSGIEIMPRPKKEAADALKKVVSSRPSRKVVRVKSPPGCHEISQRKLPQPRKCPYDIYKLMQECWELDPHQRKKPQAIMRDINQILYQEDTYLDYSKSDVLLVNVEEDAQESSATSVASSLEDPWLLEEDKRSTSEASAVSPDLTSIFLSSFPFSPEPQPMDSITSMQGIFELDGNCNVVLQGRIGQGFYGEVYRGTLEQGSESEPQLVAVKKLKTNALGTTLQDFEREISIMKTLKHTNIVEIKGVIQEPEVSLVMEYVQHGSLQSYLKIHRDTLEHPHLLKFALDVARGMEYLGHKNIVHRDLAARNILVASDNHVKISDFGLAQVMGNNGYYILKTNRELPIKWYAPESLRDGKFSPCSDVWSYGVTLYEMFSFGDDPKLPEYTDEQDQSQLLVALERGVRLPCPPTCEQSVYARLMCPCWQADMHARPTFTQLCQEIEVLR